MPNEDLISMVNKLKSKENEAKIMSLHDYRKLIINIRKAKHNLMKQYELYYELEKTIHHKAMRDGHARIESV